MTLFQFYIIFIFIIGFVSSEIKNIGWWENSIFYQIYPRSFVDYNGDGDGDLRGITSRLEHFVDLGVGAIWMSPIYVSPMVDNGYDVSDYRRIDPQFGTLDDFEQLTKRAKELGIRVVIDFVPNHTSDLHDWFIKSVNGVDKYKDYYVWREGRVNNTQPPNNWLSIFYGSAWKYNEKRDLWYLHQYEYRQPDLNYTNPDVQQEMVDILKFWLDRGVNGFRFDAPFSIYEDDRFLDEPLSHIPGVDVSNFNYLNHIYTVNDPRDVNLIENWNQVLRDWADEHNEEERIVMSETYSNSPAYINYGANVPFNFNLIFSLNDTSKPSNFKNVIESWSNSVPPGGVANWVTSNHDQPRITARYAKKPDLMIMVVMVLPGVACFYYGEEIAMEDNKDITWEETRDAMACATNSKIYQEYTRDPCRTPFQWDNTTNANFSNAEKPWLPIHKNYVTLNLQTQKNEENSPYKLFKALSSLKRTSETLRNGTVNVDVLNDDTVLVICRKLSTEAIVLVNNFSDNLQTIDASNYLPGSESVTVFVSSRGSNVEWGSSVSVSNVQIPSKASLLLISTIQTSN